MEFTFKLTEQETQVVLNTIAKEPLFQVFDIFNKIQSQASEQMKQEETKKPFYVDAPGSEYGV